ncbi:acyltransferase [uncultured Dokdonia sp.]|uniref:acyltransferase family protein n=1 Tax=uncultured Dokdonia sp. TaxID=575653 RepID=UPI002621BD8C|nr:acyltransferase [uncultured Dokdonia sp.]
MKIDRVNNFDLIRLLAAIQVVLFHSYEHLQIKAPAFKFLSAFFLEFFPGVAIFFFISGFLIYASFDRNKQYLKKYFKNRVLRIFPALWICLIITIILLVLDFPGKWNNFFEQSHIIEWFFAQSSLFQFYTPDELRYWGVGTPNGSLWTITVEFQFYLVIPFLYYFINKFKNSLIPLALILIVSIAVNFYIGTIPNEYLTRKLGAVFVLPYLYYFLIGVGFYIHWNKIKTLFENTFLKWFILYLVFMYITKSWLDFDTASYWIKSPLNIIASLLLAGVTFSAAFTKGTISSRILKGNDISYGIYIYHMLVVNFMVERGLEGNTIYIFIVLLMTIILATFSWKFIEKPALSFKKVKPHKNSN